MLGTHNQLLLLLLLLLKVYREVDGEAESHQFNSVQTPVDMFDSISAESHVLEYMRLPITDDAAPVETVRNAVVTCKINHLLKRF